MANLCDFNMVLRGTEGNCKDFIKALTQEENVWIGRGAEITTEIDTEEAEDGKVRVEFGGWCKWSICSALIDNAKSMKTEPNKWAGLPENGEILTIDEACRKYNVDCEVFSEECGIGFQEHYLIRNGKIEIDECVDWEEDEFGNSVGGLEDWEFEI